MKNQGHGYRLINNVAMPDRVDLNKEISINGIDYQFHFLANLTMLIT